MKSSALAGITFLLLGFKAFAAISMDPDNPRHPAFTHCPKNFSAPSPDKPNPTRRELPKDLARLKSLYRMSTVMIKELIKPSPEESERRRSRRPRWFRRSGGVFIYGIDVPTLVEDLYSQIRMAEQRANETLDSRDLANIFDLAQEWFDVLLKIRVKHQMTTNELAAVVGLKTMKEHPFLSNIWGDEL